MEVEGGEIEQGFSLLQQQCEGIVKLANIASWHCSCTFGIWYPAVLLHGISMCQLFTTESLDSGIDNLAFIYHWPGLQVFLNPPYRAASPFAPASF